MPIKNIEKRKEYQRIWNRKKVAQNRFEALKKLGGKCVECGIDDFRVLQIDHIIPIRRKSLNSHPLESGSRITQGIANGKRKTKGLQILCANCHQIKSSGEAVRIVK